MGTLGFVIDDADGIGGVGMDMSTNVYDSGPDAALGASETRGWLEDGPSANIRTLSAGTASSPLKKRVVASLIHSSSSSSFSPRPSQGGMEGEMKVPAWFPWLPTREQINVLKVKELREACLERGLDKLGNKQELQLRLLDWTTEQHKRRVLERRTGLKSGKTAPNQSPLDDMLDQALPPSDIRGVVSSSSSVGFVDPLINRRKALRRAKKSTDSEKGDLNGVNGSSMKSFSSLIRSSSPQKGKGFMQRPEVQQPEEDDEQADPLQVEPTDDYLSSLRKMFESPTAKFSNFEINAMYHAAKRADQNGDRQSARKILLQLKDATPKDSRVYRRLARISFEEGDMFAARSILREGLHRNPNSAHLLQGLAQLELKSGDDSAARALFKDAIRADPKFPNPYHALGTLEHSRGNIRVATTVLRHGIKMCPRNHRLHHALGDLYREAQMYDMAEREYSKALDCGTEWSKSFSYTALSYLAYEKGDLIKCRKWLHEGTEINWGMHSQGWLALARLDESEGKFDQARTSYVEAVTQYERRKIGRSVANTEGMEKRWLSTETLPEGLEEETGKKVVLPSLSGDKWIFVYKSWARMEEHHGTFDRASLVYHRALTVFPGNVGLLLDWARLHAKQGLLQKARSLFQAACNHSGSRRAEPYRLYAEFEMSIGNHKSAQSILYLGAQSLSESHEDGVSQSEGLAKLYHTWAVCEWHLGNLDRTEVLFDHALRLTNSGQKGSEMRSLILYSISRFLYHAREDLVLAQHTICLSLKENFMPGGTFKIWNLWSNIAASNGNDELARHCRKQAKMLSEDKMSLDLDDGISAPISDPHSLITGSTVQNILRKEPWHLKIAGMLDSSTDWYHAINFPEPKQTAPEEITME